MSAIDRLNSVDYDDAILHGDVQPQSESILVVPFWKPWFCKMVIEAADEHNDYHPYEYDMVTGVGAAPGQECRIDQFSPWLFERYKEHWVKWVAPAVISFYRIKYIFDRPSPYRTPFIVKYEMDGQTSMAPHHDTSVVSMSMMLNGDYDGSYLWFPRQRFTNKHVKLGWATIFPGQCSHIHEATRLLSGVRYGLTGWIKGGDLSADD